MGHSFGCLQLINYLMNYEHEIKTDNNTCAKIKAVALMAPFFEFYSPVEVKFLLSLYMAKYKFSSEETINKAFVFEQ